MTKAWSDIRYQSSDGLQLYARDYPNAESKLTLMCLHGLTRNSADFEDLCEILRGRYRIIVPDQRGRGLSQYDSDASHYLPVTYAADMLTLIDQLQLQNVVLIGTSMGGLIAMLLNAMRSDFFRAVVLNDIGPEVNPAGLERIKSYLGKEQPVANWAAAATEVERLNGAAFPFYSAMQWMRFARRTYGESENGELRRQYDPAISRPVAGEANSVVPPDLWPLFSLLARQPLLVIRGALSDILVTESVAKMRQAVPEMEYIEIDGVGHAPMLDEPEALAAIQNLLSKLCKDEEVTI